MSNTSLLTLRTDLKSLRYGNDKPYVTKSIDNPPPSNGIGMQVTKRIDDVSRIAQMLVDRPGLKFVGNQALLQQTDTINKLRNAEPGGVGRQSLQIVKDTVIQTAKVVGSTLAQVPVNGTGTHFVYGFNTNTYLKPSGDDGRSPFAQFFGAGGVEGAPLALRGETVPSKPENVVSNFETGEVGQLQPDFTEYSNTGSYVQSITQPGTVSNVSSTEIVVGSIPVRGYEDEEINPADKLGLRQPVTSSYTSNKTYYTEQKTRKINGTEKNVIKDTRINLGDQGKAKPATYYTDYSNEDSDSVDKLNALDIQNSRPDGINEARDLAKFFFEVITPDKTRFLNFRAFITSLDDSYNGTWEGKRYVGRADEFYTYGGFSRDINISFTIAAATRSEMKPLYKKMVYLASTTAPTYGDSKFMRGTVVRLSLGSYFNEIPGVITSVKYSWKTDYPWEIAMESPEGGETGVQELPMVLDCSISFKPIHDFIPQTGLQHYFTSREKGKTFF